MAHGPDGCDFAERQAAGMDALLVIAELGGVSGRPEGAGRPGVPVERIVWDAGLPAGLLAVVPEGGAIHVSASIPAWLRCDAIKLARRGKHAK